MADSAQAEGRNGSGSGNGKPPERPGTTHAQAAYSHAAAYEFALAYARARALVSFGVKGSGLLAFLLATVILLGGYVSDLLKEDFFCITVITVIQAAGILKDWERSIEYLASLYDTFALLMFKTFGLISNFLFMGNFMGFLISSLFSLVVVMPLLLVAYCVNLIYVFGPFACAAISSWRIAKLNHGNRDDETDGEADMMTALNIFYSLVIFQGTMFGVLAFNIGMGDSIVANRLLSLEQQLSDNKWGKEAIRRYISDISTKCKKDPLSIKGRDLIKYAADLLDSESLKDYLYGARLLSAFVNKGEDVRWLLIPSTHRIQRLIDSLMISSSSSLDEACVQFTSYSSKICFAVIGGLDDKKEIRELAATIVAHVAAHIDDLSKYPGAMRCIFSLLQDQEETTQTCRNRNRKQLPDDPPPHQRPIGPVLRLGGPTHIQQLMRHQKRMEIRKHQHRSKREGGTSNKLVQQGLTILELLASNSDDNRRIICGAPGLLPKITAPIDSATLIEDVKTSKAWADIVARCLKVLYQLIRASGRPSRRLRRQIFSKHQAMSNLKSLLLELDSSEAHHQELRLLAMEILTELALDVFINLSEEIENVLVKEQLQLFLLGKGDGAATAGRTLVSLSTNSKSNSSLIMTTQADVIGPLTEILDDKKNVTQRTIAAWIMGNLCDHCNVDNIKMKEILQKVLGEIMSARRKSQQREKSADQNSPANNSGDEESQGNPASTKRTEERHSISEQGDDTEIEEISDQEREEQEALLSLAQVICHKLSSKDLDGAIQNSVDPKNEVSEEQRRGTFVDKLKTIIQKNRHARADCLRIVKLCGQIGESTMRCQEYKHIFINKEFNVSLSEASKTMSELENCMRFVGTDFGIKKTVKPLFSEIEKTWSVPA